MADLVITAANVVAGSNSEQDRGLAGETVAAGKAGYLDETTRRWMLADNNSATSAARRSRGIFLNGASAGQPVVVHKSGDLVIGATLTPGASYWLSDSPGGICPDADVGTGESVCLIGLAKSTSVLAVDFQFPNVAR